MSWKGLAGDPSPVTFPAAYQAYMPGRCSRYIPPSFFRVSQGFRPHCMPFRFPGVLHVHGLLPSEKAAPRLLSGVSLGCRPGWLACFGFPWRGDLLVLTFYGCCWSTLALRGA
eukprot:8251766-Ditylum_brightwellii.AAC.1